MRRSDSTAAPFLSLAETAARGLERDLASLLLTADVTGALASFRAFAFQGEFVISCSGPALTNRAGPEGTLVAIGTDVRTVASAEVAVLWRLCTAC
jgi:hypothetical protein